MNGRALNVGGVVVAICLLLLAGLCYGPAGAQSDPPLKPPPRVETEPPPVSLPPDAPRPSTFPERRGASVSGVRETPSLRAMGIDQLVDHLNDLRAKKAELDKQEKEAVSVLKEKLKEQKQKLEQLGIRPEEPTKAPPPIP